MCSASHILKELVGGRVAEGIDEEASKSCRHGVGGGMGACAWGIGGWRKEKDMSRGLSAYI